MPKQSNAVKILQTVKPPFNLAPDRNLKSVHYSTKSYKGHIGDNTELQAPYGIFV